MSSLYILSGPGIYMLMILSETIDEVDEGYSEDQTAESFHMDTEVKDSTCSSGNFA